MSHAVSHDLGNDSVYIFAIDVPTVSFSDSGPAIIPASLRGLAPGISAFHPNGRWGYGLTEGG